MNQHPPKAAIVDWAWRTPLGSEVDAVVQRLHRGEYAAKLHDRIPEGAYATKVSAPIVENPARSRNARFVHRIGLLAMEAAREAFEGSGIDGGARVGVFAGYGGLRVHWDDVMVALEDQQDDSRELWERGLRKLHPFWMLNHLSNNAHALVAAELGLKGVGLTLAGANAGAQALSSAIEALDARTIDAALVFAYDTLISPNVLVEWGVRGQATTAGPGEVVGPYDRASAGIVPAEAACAVVLKRPMDAAETSLGLVSALDGADGSTHRPRPEAFGSMIDAFGDESCAAIGVVDGDARAQPDIDRAERQMLAGRVDASTPLISTSAAVGYTGAARPVFQAIALTQILRGGVLPPIAGLTDVAPGPLEPIAAATTTQARAAIGIHSGAPGLAGIVRVEIP
jgi:3-oxoacyl-(acyl-carrier-protein) synthase